MRRPPAALLCAIASVAAVACFQDQFPEGGDATQTDSDASSGATTGSSGSGDTVECACAPTDSCVQGTCVPAGCGDGVVDADEACDEGPDNAPSGACKLDCTVQACGDGELGASEGCDDGNLQPDDGCDAMCVLESCGNGAPDEGESCDDGNRRQGDGCNNDCQPSGEIMWEHLHDPIGGADTALDLTLFPTTGDVVVVGSVVDTVRATQWWRVLDPNGAVTVTSPPMDNDAGVSALYGVACDPPLCVAVGTQYHEANGIFSAVTRLFGPDGDPDQPTELPNAMGTGRGAYGLAYSPGGLDIVGFLQNGGAGTQDGLLEELDGTLAPTNVHDLLPGPDFSVLRKLIRVGDRRHIVGWSQRADQSATLAYLLRVDDDGSVASTIDVGGSDFVLALALAHDPDNGSTIVTGYRSDVFQMTGPGSAVLRRYAANDALVWQKDASYGGEAARFDAVALTPGGDIVATGGVRTAEGGVLDILVARHAPNGDELWSRVITDPGFDLASAVAIDPETEAIYVGGRRTVSGTEDVWVARYSP